MSLKNNIQTHDITHNSLSEKQKNAYTLIINGKNIFLTGVGGTGKSAIINLFNKEYNHSRTIGITSTTGTSAILIGGSTIHSFLGIGLGKGDVEFLYMTVKNRSNILKRWIELDTLIIDEISMLHPDLFDKLENLARVIRKNDNPFGGIQLILTGDFCFSGNTQILSAYGKTILAKDIKIGDELMGDDGKTRKVLRLFRGYARMYKISTLSGNEIFTVTGKHILCLKIYNHISWNSEDKKWVIYFWNKTEKKILSKIFTLGMYGTKENALLNASNFTTGNDIIEMSVKEYMDLSQVDKDNLACYKVGIADWPYIGKDLLIHPRLLGLWLSDSNIDGDTDNGKQFKELLHHYNLINNKHIPDDYIYSTRDMRLQLLSGLLEIGGRLFIAPNPSFYISNTNLELSKQICFLSRSLGFMCSLHIDTISDINLCTCLIRGNIEEIPYHNNHNNSPRIIDETINHLLTKFDITILEEDNFYGFETDKNKRFLLGDFTVAHNCQLPVVGSDKFCFEAKSWDKCIDKVVYLTENFRQDNIDFQECLREVRLGKLSSKSFELLKSRENIILKNDLGILPTKLFALNRNVDIENKKEIENLFISNPDLDFYEYHLEHEILKKGFKNSEKILNNCAAPGILELCIGVQVMLLYNMDLDAKLANGSRGVVIRFDHDMPVVRFITGEERIIDYYTWKIEENGADIMNIKQIPLKVAYAVSIHRSQGLTLDYVEIDMDGIFEDGQGYVALSRVKTLEGLSIKNLKTGNIFANKKALQFYKNIE